MALALPGQMTVEEVIEDIEQGRDGRRVYIPLIDIHYEGQWPLVMEGDKAVMAEDNAVQSFVTREDAQRVADLGSRGSGTSPTVWEIILPAETTPSRGESEKGHRG